MRFFAFSIFDVKSDTYSPPFFKPAIGAALRDFEDLANDRNTTIGRHPEDFKLVQVGEFDDTSGAFVQGSQIVSLGFASDLVVKTEAIPLPTGKRAS